MKRISLIFITLLINACDLTYLNSDIIGKAIGSETRTLKKQNITLSELTSFTWDELYLFAPYTAKNSVCKQLKIPVNKCEKTITNKSVDDGEMYIVFRNNGEIVHQEVHFRSNGDFTPINYKLPITPTTAVFSVKYKGQSGSGKPWLKLELSSNNMI